MGKVSLRPRKNATKSFITKDELSEVRYKFTIHDNGGRPFKAIASCQGIHIYRLKKDYDYNSNDYSGIEESRYENKPFKIVTEFEGLWAGRDFEDEDFCGNSILIKLEDHEYIFVGWKVQGFSTKDIMIDYESPVGNSDVSYPVAFGDTFIYFMNEMKVAAIKDFKRVYHVGEASAMCSEFYGHFTIHKGWQTDLKNDDMDNVRLIHDRL